MTDLNKLADDQIVRAAEILEGYAEFIRAEQGDNLERHPYIPEIEEAARILRAAAGVDVQGLMAKAMTLVGALSDACKMNSSETFAEAVADLESALRLTLAGRDGFVLVPVEPSKFNTEIQESGEKNVYATVDAACLDKYTVEASRDDDLSDWYITVTAPNGMKDYDGWWRNSDSKTVDEVIKEAIHGACLMTIQELPKAAAAPKGTP